MIKVKNIVINDSTITMECLGNGLESDRHQMVLDKETFEILPGETDNIYVQKARAKARSIYEETGNLPSEFTSVWY